MRYTLPIVCSRIPLTFKAFRQLPLMRALGKRCLELKAKSLTLIESGNVDGGSYFKQYLFFGNGVSFFESQKTHTSTSAPQSIQTPRRQLIVKMFVSQFTAL